MMRARISPASPRSTASGLVIANVRSAKDFPHLRAPVSGTLDHVHTRLRQRFHLLRRGALTAGDDRARVPHSSSWRRGLAGDEADDGLAEVLLDPRRRLLFR